MTFRFRKLYADIVSSDGTVSIVYLAWLEALGVRFSSASVERYHADGRHDVQHARPPAWSFDPDSVRDGWRVRLEFPHGAFELHYHGTLPPWRPVGPPPHPAMDWRVLIPRAAVAGSSAGLGAGGEFHGTGYCDWVELRHPPRLLGMSALRWGRAHLPGETVVFTALAFGSGRTWTRASCWRGGEVQRDAVVGLEFGEAGSLGIGVADAKPLTLMPSRILHDGPGLNRARFATALTRVAAHALTGSLQERRWLASLPNSCGLRPASAVHELVTFGARGHAPGFHT
jgi:hypothetical protein